MAAKSKTKEKAGLPALTLPQLSPAEQEEFEQQMLADAKDAAARVVPTAQWISLRGRQASLGGIPITLPIDVVALEFSTERAFYDAAFDPDNMRTPICWAVTDGKPTESRPDPSSSQPQATACALCPHNAYRTSATGKGKACAEHRRVALVAMNEDGPPDLRGVKVPPTSLKLWDNYVTTDLKAAGGTALYSVITEIDWNGKIPTWPALTFKAMKRIDPRFYALLKQILPSAKELVMSPFQQQAALPAPAASSNGKKRAAEPKVKGAVRKKKF